ASRLSASARWSGARGRASSMTARSISDRRMTRKRVAVLISGRGSNMAALIAAARANDYPAEIVLVVSNVPDAGGLAIAKEAGIATAVADHRTYGKDRTAFDHALQDVLLAHKI